MMLGQQLDLFSGAGLRTANASSAPTSSPRLDPSNLDDAALVAALPGARVADCRTLCAEAGRRRLIEAIPALEALCRRFKGFGLEHAVPEQTAALRGLAAIGTREAATAVSLIMADKVVQGPGLQDAVDAAVILQCRLPPAVSLPLLQHNDPRVRAAACRCARLHADIMPLLVDLLNDLHRVVAVAAACALGRAGRIEARPMLASLLREEPSAEVVDAVTSLADEDCIVQLGRIGRTNHLLSAAVLNALEEIDDARARAIAETVRRSLGSQQRGLSH